MAAKKPVPSKKPAAKKPTAQELKRAYNKNLVANRPKPAKPQSISAKMKVKPYSAIKRSKRSGLDKFAEGVLAFSPLGGIKYAAEAITGRDLSAPAGSKKKTSRVGALGNAALIGLPVVKAGKKVVKVVRAGQRVNASTKLIKENKTNYRTGVKVYDTKKKQMGK